MSKRLQKQVLQSKRRNPGPVPRRGGVRAESLESRLLLAGHPLRMIAGHIFNDINGNGTRQAKEHWLAGVVVFLDINSNGVQDAGEPATTTNKLGAFTFRRLTSGTYDVVAVPPAGDVATIPSAGAMDVNINKRSVSNLRFGDQVAPTPPVKDPLPDTSPPGGALDAPALTTSGYTPYRFSVTWTDATAVDVSSFGDGNVVVTGPGGYDQPGNLVALDATTNGSPRTSTYQVPAPTGGWTLTSDGSYAITLIGGQIRDTLGNADPTLTLGSFSVDSGADAPGAPTLVGGVNGATAQNNASAAQEISFNVSNTVVGAQLTIEADGLPIGSATAAAGSTVITTNGQLLLSDGTHQFSVTQTIGDGPASISAPTNITIDSAGPAASLNAATITAAGGSTYTFTVTYTDATAVSVASLAGGNLQVSEPGAKLQTPTLVSLDANTDGPVRVATYRISAPGGSWNAADDGTYTVTLLPNEVLDEVDNAAATRVIGTFAVSVGEVLSPTTGTPVLLPASDTGAFNNDDVTNLNDSSPAGKLQISVPGTQSGATVTIFADGTPIGSATANGTTTTVTTTGHVTLSDGTHLLTAEQTNPKSGPSLASPALGIVVDTQVPTAASSPASVSGAGATSYSFLVVYRDNISVDISHLGTGDVMVTGPNGFSQSAVFQSVNSSGDGSPRTATYTITPPGGSWNAVDNGTYTVAMRGGQVFDTAGNTVVAGTLGTFTVNAGVVSSPVPLAPNLATSSDTGASATDNLTDLNNGSVAGELQFSVAGTSTGATITVYSDGTPIGAVVASGPTTVVTTNGTAPLSDGPHTITARQTIPGAGQSTDSAGVSITIDTTLPTASGLSAPNVNSGGASSYTFTVTYADNVAINVSSLGSHDVTVTGPGGINVPVTFVPTTPDPNAPSVVATYQIVPPDGAWSSADNGAYAVNFSAGQVRDTAGNFSTSASLGSFNVNVATLTTASTGGPTLAPASDTGMLGSDNLTNLNNSSASQSLQFIVSGTISGATVTVYADGTPIGTATASGSSTTVKTTGKFTLSDGSHTITSSQQSPGQTQSAVSASLLIDVETSTPTASASFTDITSSGGVTYAFTVTYTDPVAINPTTFNSSNIIVTSTTGYSAPATLVAIDNPSAGSPRNVTYQIVPADGAWSTADNGVYTVTLQVNQVFNTAGTAVPGVVLGTFNVNIAPGA